MIEEALDEVKELDRQGKFEMCPKEVNDGVLGDEGTSQFAELNGPGTPEEDNSDGKTLQTFDYGMTYMTKCIAPYFEETLGFTATTRTNAMVIQGGKAMKDTPE